jgi:hypothetical protein
LPTPPDSLKKGVEYSGEAFFFQASIMKLHHQESFETEVFVTISGPIRIQQKIDNQECFSLLTKVQAEQLLQELPTLIVEQTQNLENPSQAEDLSDES